MEILFTVVHVVAALFLVLVVLLQSGRGGGMGAAFGGASSQIFGGRGANNFLTRVTTGAAIVFFVTSFSLSYFSSQQHSVMLRAGRGPVAKPTAQATGASGEINPDDDSLAQGEKAAPEAATPHDPEAPAPTPVGVPAGETP